MKKLATVIAAAAALTVISGVAWAAPAQLRAFDAKGKLVKAGKFSKTTRVYRAADLKRLKPKTRKRYKHKRTLCKKVFMLRSTQVRWLAAHKKAKHKIVLRQRVAKRKFKNLCTL